MKSIFAIVALTLVSIPSFAQSVELTMFGPKQDLSEGCDGGTANAFLRDGAMILRLKNVVSCSKLELLSGVSADSDTVKVPVVSHGKRSLDYTVDSSAIHYGRNVLEFRLSSRSGVHSEKITVIYNLDDDSFPSTPVTITMNGHKVALPACQGTVNAFPNQQTGLVTIRFKQVGNCNKLELVGANYLELDTRTITLPGTPGNYAGDFTINPALIHEGYNVLKFVLKGKHGVTDAIILDFKERH